MAVEVTTLQLDARLTNAEQTIAQLQRLKQTGDSSEQSFGKLAMQIAGLNTGFGLVVQAGQKVLGFLKDTAKESITLAASFEKSRMTWGVLVGDMTKGSQVFNQLYAFASKTPLSFEGVNQAATTLKAYGIATKDLIPTMQRLGDVAMGDNQRLDGIARAYGQIMSTGRLMGQDLLQLINQGFNPLQVIGEKTGESMADLKDRMQDGKISAQEVAEAFRIATSEGGQFHGMMDTTAETAAGKWSTALDAWKSNLADLGNNVLPLVTRALDAANAAMDKWAARTAGSKAAVNEASLVNLVSSGNSQGVLEYLNSQKGSVGRGTVNAWISAAAKANPLPTKAQALALAQAKAMVELFPWNINPPPSVAPTSTGSTEDLRASWDFGASEAIMARNLYEPEAAYLLQDRTASPGESYLSGAQYPDYMLQDMTAGTGVASSIYDNQIAKLIREQEAAERTASAMDRLKQSMEGVASSAVVSSFQSIGAYLAAGSSGAETFGDAMSDIGQQATSQFGSLMTTLGLQLLIKSGGLDPAGWAFLAAGGLVSIGAGAWNYANSSSSNGTSTAADEINADLANYYLAAEAFNSQGRNRAALTGYARGGIPDLPGFSAYRNMVVNSPHFFGFASGGVFGEAGYEAAVPLVRTKSGNLGVETAGAANVNVIINPPSGYEATREETVDSAGIKTLTVGFKRIVKSMVTSGELDSALDARSAARVGRRISG